jgi:LmbE family N-acetylglucosaminyl deacetylase
MVPVTAPPAPEGYLGALRCLPVVTPEALLAGRHLVVVAPHPDDESLGMGGLIAAAQELGAGVTVVFLTDGEASHVGSTTYPPSRLALVRRAEATAALGALGVPGACAHFMALGDARLPNLPALDRTAAMQHLHALVHPSSLVCVTAPTDPHGDHQAASALVQDIPWDWSVAVMHCPVWTWSAPAEALPARTPDGFRIDIAPWLSRKTMAVAAHRSQHGGVIEDATEAFELDPRFVAQLLTTTETLTWPV